MLLLPTPKTIVSRRDLKAIAPFVSAHPRCAVWVYGRWHGMGFNTGLYGRQGVGLSLRGYNSFNIKVIHIQ